MAETGFRKWIIVVTVILASLLEIIDSTVVNVSLTQIMGNLGGTLEDAAWLITAYGVANVIILPMTGWLSAKFGRKNYFAFSIILFTVASFLCGNSHNIWELAIFRFVQGIGGGALLSTSQSILFETFAPEDRGMATAIFGLGVIIGPTVGPTLGGYITDHFSWPWIFYINLPLGAIAAVLTFIYIKESTHNQRKVDVVDWLGIALLIVGIGSLQIVLERGESEDWFETTYIIVLAVVSLISIVAFIWRELVIDHPIVDLRILSSSRSLAVGMFFTFILGFGLYSSVFVLPIFCQNLLGFTAQQTGWLLFPAGLATAFMMPIIGTIIRKGFPPQVLAGIGFGAFFLFTSWLSKSTLASGENDFFWPLMLRAVGMACLFVPLTNLAFSGVGKKDMPQATGLNNMMRQLGGSFGIAIMTTFIAQRTAYHRMNLITHITDSSVETMNRLNASVANFLSKGYSLQDAQAIGYKSLEGAVIKQSLLMSYMDSFFIVGLFFLICIPLLTLSRRAKNAPVVMDAH